MSKASFKVNAQLDSAGGKKPGLVTIDRETNIITVRPHRSHQVYCAKLDDLADLVVKRVLTAGFETVYDPKKAKRKA